ncbi:TPA: hypothetical protein ACGO1T_001934 [Streptococcus suis]
MAIKMFLNSKGVEFETLNPSDLPDYVTDEELPVLMRDSTIEVTGYDPSALASIFK